jgi:hypothetical protein
MEIERLSKYNSFLTKNNNIIWAGALGLAWNQIIDTFDLEDIQV